MKRVPVLLCAAILAAMPMASQADGLPAGLSVGLAGGGFMWPQDDRRHGRADPPGNERRDNRYAPAPQQPRYNAPPPQQRYNPPPPAQAPAPGNGYRRDPGAYDRRPVEAGGGEFRDARINRAMDIGRAHGRVLNAWPQGGSLFLVRVETPRGRVDMLIDVDTGRVVGER